jgi:hypothetical protein
MFIEYIERLRKEPKDVRQRAVYTWTAIMVAIIALGYIVFRVYDISAPSEDTGSLAAPYESR